MRRATSSGISLSAADYELIFRGYRTLDLGTSVEFIIHTKTVEHDF